MISSTEPDWSREALTRFQRAPGKRLLASIRRYHRFSGNSLYHRFQRAAAVLAHRKWTSICSSDIPLNVQIDGGLLLPHPFAIVIHPNTVIGPNCLIFQGVTIGTVGHGDRQAPRIGGHVDIGAGAKILGKIKLGDHSRIGANAVVLTDVPDHALAVGIPARIIPQKYGPLAAPDKGQDR